METRDFLQKVLPATKNDFYTLWVKGVKHAKDHYNAAFSNLEECVAAIKQLDTTDYTVYFAVGKHNTKGRRTKETASSFQACAFDVDVGEKKYYKSQRDAARDVLAAFQKLVLPTPMIISSGYGLHFYIPFTIPISASDWERLSLMLRAALAAHNVHIDTTKISDRSMVLRPVDSHNKKDIAHWRRVSCLQDAPAVDPRSIIQALSNIEAPPVRAAAPPSVVSDAILHGDSTINPVALEKLTGCQQIAALLANKGADAEEPLWRASLGIAKYCIAPEEAIVALASGHPDYDFAKNKEKMLSWKGDGPPTCSYLEQINPKGCAGCAVKDKLKTPLVLDSQVGENLTDPYLAEIRFPKGYSYDGKWLTYKPMEGDPIYICPFLIYPVAQYTDQERKYTVVKLRIKYPHTGWQTVDLEQSALTSDGKDFNNFIFSKQLWLHDGSARYLRTYLVTYLRELTQAVQTSLLYDHYGWQEDGRFLAGDKLVSGKGVTTVQHSKLATQFNSAMIGKGSLAAWSEATSMFGLPELEYHGFAFLVGLAGPMMVGSNLEALLVNMYSPDSGSGKTLTGMYALSAWGAPEKLFLTIRDTDNAIYKTLGTMHSTAAYIDEITMVDPDRLCDMVYSATQGREKIRLARSAKELLSAATWKMPILSSSNQDLLELVSNRVITEAQRQRILQLPLHRVAVFDKGGDNLGFRVANTLKENYGLAGIELVKELIRRGGISWITARFNIGLGLVEEKYNIAFEGPERYMQAALVLADMVGEVCTDLGLIKFDYAQKVQQVAEYIRRQRTKVEANRLGPVDTINQYLLEKASQIVFYREFRDNGKATSQVLQPMPKSAVARIETVSTQKGSFLGGYIYINRTVFRRWVADIGIDYAQLLTRLENSGTKVDDNCRYTLYKGVMGMGGVGQTRCLQIDMASNLDFVNSGISSIGEMTTIEIAERLKEIKNG